MNPFAAIEDACARFVERTFARIFPSDVAPAHIARKLVATMQSTPAGTYLVRLHPRDVAGLGEERAFLENDWSMLLSRTAETQGVQLAHAVRVILHPDEEVVAGTVAVDAVIDDDVAASARGYVATIVKGLPQGARFPLEGIVRVGRGAENTIDLVDLRVSRKHAQFERTGEGVVLEDRGSTNGTFLNGERVAPKARRRVVAGDRVVVGDTELAIEVGDG
jgi:hypothetical protein